MANELVGSCDEKRITFVDSSLIERIKKTNIVMLDWIHIKDKA